MTTDSNWPVWAEEEQSWIAQDGTHYPIMQEGDTKESAFVDYVTGHALGFCGCGNPTNVLRYVHRMLSDLKARRKRSEISGTPEQDFFWYWADNEKITEHGSCIPGWLTNKGEQLLAIIERALEYVD